MAEAFVRTIKRDYVRVSPRPDAETVMRQLPVGSPTTTRFTRTRLSDIVHPVSSSQLTQDPDRVRSFGGYNTGDASHSWQAQMHVTYRAGICIGFAEIRVLSARPLKSTSGHQSDGETSEDKLKIPVSPTSCTIMSADTRYRSCTSGAPLATMGGW
jgi:hypothetical protein